MRFKKIALGLLLLPCALFAQDSLRLANIKTSTRYFTQREVDQGLSYRQIDTNSNKIEVFNPIQKKAMVYQDLGNIGLSARPLLFETEKSIGFNYSFNPYQSNFFTPERTQYNNTKTPYSDLTAAQGGNEMLFLNFKHSQNVLPRWNIGVELLRTTSRGFLLRQYSSIYDINAFTAFSSKNKRYILLANVIWNFGLNEESGGITSDSSYETLTGKQKQVYTNLNNCETHFRNRSAFVRQYFRWGQSKTNYSETDTTYDFIPKTQLVYTFKAEQMSYAFYNNGDTNSVLLPHQYYDIGKVTYDSSYSGKLSNRVDFQWLGSPRLSQRYGSQEDSIRTHLSVGATQELINVAQPAFVRQYQNIILHGEMNQSSLIDFSDRYHVRADYVVSGYNSGDYKLDAAILFKYNWFSWKLMAVLQQYHPDFKYSLYKTNQFIWDNQFNPIHTSYTGIGIVTRKWRQNLFLLGKIQTMDNWVYMNEKAVPQQMSNTCTVISIQLNKTFQVGRMRFEHELVYQKSGTNNIRIPEFAAFIRYYYQYRFFGMSKLQIGFNAFYNTAYYGNSFNPSSHEFYLQNQTLIGNYPVVNLFMVSDIKRASIFAVFEHFNMDWMTKGQYYTPHYPVALNAFRLGVRWRFYD